MIPSHHGAHGEHGVALLDEELTEAIIGAAIEVHRELGPGLLESAYEECLCFELCERGHKVDRQVPMGLTYKGIELECGYRLDLLVDDKVLVELKAIEKILPIHEAQLMTYLRLSGHRTGLILNFNVKQLKDGITRRVL